MASRWVLAQVISCLVAVVSAQLLRGGGGVPVGDWHSAAGSRPGSFSPDQRRQIQAQQDFRRAVAEANNRQATINVEPKFLQQQLPVPVSPTSASQLADAPQHQQQQKQHQHHQQQQATINPTPTPQHEAQQLKINQHRLRPHRPGVDQLSSLPSPANRQLPQFDEELFREQAESARYSFESSVSDTINDSSHVRQETRDGLNLSGLYSYTDGFFKRTVHYEADENGYRIVKEETEPIGLGPKIDPEGRVDVSTNIGGNSLQYSYTATDIPSFERQSLQQQNEQKRP